jgi:hypothetical protein
MQIVAQDSTSKKHVNSAPASLSKAKINTPVKTVVLSPAKDNSLERLLASCCDCV